MIPVVISSPGGDCFAMYGAAPGPAILICPPIGDEALRTARVWRDLAVRLAGHGFATLRFDLPGTGNSAGEATEPGRVEAWRAAVRACIDWLSPRHDGRIILFGHRFGALLALDAATSGIDVERLVLLDPPASGQSVARYWRARARMEQHGPAPEGNDYIQAGGLAFSQATLSDIGALAAPMPNSATPGCLLVMNDMEATSNPWPDRLREHGCVVECIPFEGHADFVSQDIFRAQTPDRVLDQVVDYLTRHRGRVPSKTNLALSRQVSLPLPGLTEYPIHFGPEQRLFGILCRPDSPAAEYPALLLPTTGADPCSGMSRMWTDLARRLATQGVTSLRFDMRGVGESEGSLGQGRLAAMYHSDRIADLAAAVDALVLEGFSDVKVVGYCAGAYAAWHAAIPDTRISAIFAGNLLFLNLLPTAADELLTSRPGSSQIGTPGNAIAKFLAPQSLGLLRQLDDRTRRLVPRRIRLMLRSWGADPVQTRRHVKALVDRGCSVNLVMAHDDHGHIRLRRAFGEDPRLPDGVQLTVIPDADHQFSDRRHRAQFLDLAASFALRTHARPLNSRIPHKVARILENA